MVCPSPAHPPWRGGGGADRKYDHGILRLWAFEVERKAIEVFARHFPKYPASLEADPRLSQDLGADSLDLVELLFELEQVLGCQIPAADASKLTTIGDALR